MQRLEHNSDDPRDEPINAGYREIIKLSEFYGVSADYLLGLTENIQHRNVEIDKLSLSDSAIEILTSGKVNNRLISELLSHEDFPKLLGAMEVYIDRKVLPQMSVINALYKATESTIHEKYDVGENDAIMEFLQQSVIDEDEYLRYRISERFNSLVKSLFDSHKKDTLSVEQMETITEIKEHLKVYTNTRAETGSEARSRLILLAKKIGLNISRLSQEELEILIKSLENSEMYRRGKGKKGSKRK